MGSRFQRTLNPFLDVDPLVGDAGKAATATDASTKPAPAAPPESPSWKLADVARLKNPGTVDSLFLRASGGLLGTKEGERLHNDLKAIKRKNVHIVVEAFDRSSELAERRRQLAGSTSNVEADEQVNGYTDPFRGPGDFMFALDEKTNKPTGFNVLLLVQRERSSSVGLSEDEWVTDSLPFRFLKMATTMFHELLHVHQIYTQVDFTTQTIQTTIRDIRSEDFDPDTANTGHQSAFFEINPSTLTLETRGPVESTFKRRIVTFIDQFVAKYAIADKVAKERAAFKAQTRQPR